MKRKVVFSEADSSQYDYVGVNRTGISGSGAFKKPLDSDDLCNNPMYSTSEDSPEKEIYTEIKNIMYEDTSNDDLAFEKLPGKPTGSVATADLDHLYETPDSYQHSMNSPTLQDVDDDDDTFLTAENPLYAET